jgi:hypothetical protein
MSGKIEIEGPLELARQLVESSLIVPKNVFMADHWLLEIDHLGVLRKSIVEI